MHAGDDELALACDLGVALFDADRALADRFDLGAGQNDARFKTFLDEKIVERFLVIRNYFTCVFCH